MPEHTDREARRGAAALGGVLTPLVVFGGNLVVLVLSPRLMPIETPSELFVMGVFIAQPAVYASWAALSVGPLIRRGSLAFLANAVAAGYFGAKYLEHDAFFLALVLFLALWALFSEHRRRTGQALMQQSSSPQQATPSRSMRVSDLLLVTTIVACLAVLGDQAVAENPNLLYPDDPTLLTDLVWLIPFYTVLLLPPLLLAMAMLKPSGLRPGSTAGAIVVVALLVALVAAVAALAWQVVAAYAGAFVALVGSAYVLRLAGYRLTKEMVEKEAPLSSASPR